MGRLKFFLELTGFAVGFLFIAMAFVLWRATSGPVRLDFLRPAIERELGRHAGTTIPFEHISLGSDHWNAPVMLRLEGVSLPPEKTGFPVRLDSIGVSLDFRDLLRGRVRLIGLTINRPVITVRQSDLAGAGDQSPPVQPLKPRFTLDDLLSPGKNSFLAQWQTLSLTNGEVSLINDAGQQLGVIHRLQAGLSRTRAGTDFNLSGLAGGTGPQGTVMASAHYAPGLHGTAHVQTGPLTLGLLALLSPDLKPLAMAEMPASLTLDAELQGQTPLTARLDVALGAGQVADQTVFPSPIMVSGGAFKAEYDGASKTLTVSQGIIGLDAPSLSATGTIQFGNGISVDADIGLKHMPIDAFSRYWPIGASPGGRAWVTSNISHGVVDDEMLHVKAGFGGAAASKPVEVDGHIAVSDAIVHYFGKLPEVKGVGANIDFDADSMTVHLLSGNAAGLKVSSGTVVIDGFQAKQQAIAIDLVLEGPVSAALTIVDAPPLGYAKKLGIAPGEVQGSGSTQFHMDFPLVSTLSVDQTNLRTTSALTRVTMPHVVRTYDLTKLDGTLAVDLNGLELSGHGDLADIPLQISWKQAFDAHAKPSSDGSFEGTLNDDQRKTLGLDAPDRLSGPTVVKGRYLDYGKTSALSLDADLTQAEFRIGEIAYDKPKGAAGKARATLELDNGKPARISGIDITARGFLAQGSVRFDAASGKLERLSLSSLRAGLTDVTLDFQPLQTVPALSVVGPVFDARPLLKAKPDPDAENKPAATGDTAPLALALDIGEIKAADTPGLSHVKGSLLLAGRHWRKASFTADTSGKPLSVSYQPDDGPNPGYNFVADAQDLGAVLTALDVTDTIKGGATHVEGRKPPAADDDPHPPLEGTVTVGEFTVTDPPVFARLFSALTVDGFLNSLSGSGLKFDSVSGHLAVTHEAIRINDGKAAGTGIGLTLEGTVDRTNSTLDLHGAAVPAYGINTFLNNIPVLGELLTGGDGEGVFSTTYSITGQVSDPNVFVNPISLFLPGALRDLFFELPYKIGDRERQ